MKKFAKLMLITLGFGLVASALGFLTSKPITAQLPPPTTVIPVRVTNTPLPVQGSVNANVTNTVPVSGNVTANVSGNVSVANFPATQNVSGTVALSGTSNVNVLNNEYGPVPVEPDAAAARLRFESRCLLSQPLSPYQDGLNSCASVAVASGYRLALETISLSVTVPSGTVIENGVYGVFQAPPASTIPMGFVILTKVGSDTARGLDFYVGTAPVRGYFFDGESVGCGFTTSFPTGSFQMECDVSGHLVLE